MYLLYNSSHIPRNLGSSHPLLQFQALKDNGKQSAKAVHTESVTNI